MDAEDDVGVGVEEDDVISQDVVDTDVDSAAHSASSNSDTEDGGYDRVMKKPLRDTKEFSCLCLKGARAKPTPWLPCRKSRRILWENDHFYIPESSCGRGVIIRMRHITS